jgi:hypothetical protein
MIRSLNVMMLSKTTVFFEILKMKITTSGHSYKHLILRYCKLLILTISRSYTYAYSHYILDFLFKGKVQHLNIVNRPY